MPLIVESYEWPYTKIASLLFPGQEFTYVDSPMSEPASELFCYTRLEDRPERIKYYFNRIYFVEKGRIVCINKIAQKVKLYDLNTGKLISFQQPPEDPKPVEKSEFLPQMQAQSGEIVVFPEEDDED